MHMYFGPRVVPAIFARVISLPLYTGRCVEDKVLYDNSLFLFSFFENYRIRSLFVQIIIRYETKECSEEETHGRLPFKRRNVNSSGRDVATRRL